MYDSLSLRARGASEPEEGGGIVASPGRATKVKKKRRKKVAYAYNHAHITPFCVIHPLYICTPYILRSIMYVCSNGALGSLQGKVAVGAEYSLLPITPKMPIFPWLLHLFPRGRGSTYYYVCRCSTCIWALCTRATAQTRAFMKRVVQSSPSPAQSSMQNPKETSPAGGGGGGVRACVRA